MILVSNPIFMVSGTLMVTLIWMSNPMFMGSGTLMVILNWVSNPMLIGSRDPRWGSESHSFCQIFGNHIENHFMSKDSVTHPRKL